MFMECKIFLVFSYSIQQGFHILYWVTQIAISSLNPDIFFLFIITTGRPPLKSQYVLISNFLLENWTEKKKWHLKCKYYVKIRTKYNAKASYTNSMQKNSRDSAFQTIYPYDELHMTQHSCLSRIRWMLALHSSYYEK